MTDKFCPVSDDYSSVGQLTPAQIEQAAVQGFKAALNLRLPAESVGLCGFGGLAAAAGLGYAQTPVSFTMPKGEDLDGVLATLNPLPQPVLIHRRSGGWAKARGLGPEQPQIQQFLHAHYGKVLSNAQSEVV